MKLLPTSIWFILGLGMLLAFSGCKDSAPSGKSAGDAEAAEGLPADLWLASAPAGAEPVAEVKKSAASGQDVVLFGRIGGRKDPFVSGRAMFQLSDRSIPSCVEKHGPGCATPWDYCCEAKETILAGTLTVEVVGADGRPLRAGLDGVRGLKPLADVVVRGRVVGTGDDLLIDATGIYVKQ